MESRTRQQLLSLSADFYRAHAAGFDASRGHRPWPGWERLREWLAPRAGASRLEVLDVGCGNARLARFLSDATRQTPLHYVGVDANAALLEAARGRLEPGLARQVELVEADFLATPVPGEALPRGPFDLVALFGVLHHVPGRDWRQHLIVELARRLAPGGMLALAAWQFAGRPRFERRSVAWADLGPVLGEAIDPDRLEAGDTLLRFGSDPDLPPRYCHQVADAELDALEEDLAGAGISMEALADYHADGSEANLNRYRVLRRLGDRSPGRTSDDPGQ
jgi:SAM-dependent methyltransferase